MSTSFLRSSRPSRLFAPLLAALALAACGGGGGGFDKARVTDIQTGTNLGYGNNVTFLFIGNFTGEQAFKTDIPNCLTQLTLRSTATELAISCIVTKSGPMTVRALDAAGNPVYAKTFDVPVPKVKLTTSSGDIVLELNGNEAPITVNNFLRYVRDGFYNNTIFHRVIRNFVVQGGGFKTGMVAQTGARAAIINESDNKLKNLRGTLAMARGPESNSATSQFFINVVNNASLDYVSAANPGYAVFGKVVEGMDVVDAINAVPTTTRGGHADVPVTDVVLTSATRLQ